MGDGKSPFPRWLPVFSLVGYYLIGYQLPRHDFLPLILVFTVLFISYLWWYHKVETTKEVDQAIFAAILFRCSLIIAIPSLSDDFYRYIWDGHLLNAGMSPFARLPSDLITDPNLSLGIDQDLYENLNSRSYFTVYPPLNQLMFWLSTYLFPSSHFGSVLVLRAILLMAEIGSIYLIRQLLKAKQLPEKNVLLYALNPLVVVELTGNLHFEALVIVFLLWSLLAFHQSRITSSSITLALSIGSKLVPLIFLPLLLRRHTWKRLGQYYIITGLALIVLFIPLLFDPSFISGMGNSLSLYFQKFEFNASIYYIVREIGFGVKGYNIIGSAGKGLALSSMLGIAIFALWQKPSRLDLSQAMLWTLTFYLAMSTTIHPWYVIPLVALSALGRFRFVISWSFLIFFTYIGYTENGYQENLMVVAMEYIIVFGIVILELFYPRLIERFALTNS